MNISSMMVMRAQVRRGSVAVDSFGQRAAASANTQPTIVADALPIHVWIEADTEYVDGKSVAVEIMKGYVRKDADVQRNDEILQVLDRRGRVVFAGPIVVDMVINKNAGAVLTHKLLMLRRHRGT